MAKRMAFLRAVARAIGIRPQKHWPGWKALMLREGPASLPQPLSGKRAMFFEPSRLRSRAPQLAILCTQQRCCATEPYSS
jgi:hypothetical protein